MNQSAWYQPEVDGLRALAIVPVVLFHAGVPGLRGGYLGVDIFFVLSGFLISRLLLVELQQTDKIDLAGFYARRVRRLLPALALVVAATLVLGTFILSAAIERQELSRSAIATMAFVSNIYFWRTQAHYGCGIHSTCFATPPCARRCVTAWSCIRTAAICRSTARKRSLRLPRRNWLGSAADDLRAL